MVGDEGTSSDGAGTTVRPTRWAGVPAEERTRDRRALLVDVAFDRFGTDGETATSVRAVCRDANLNARYFYESFVDLDELLGAVYDRTAAQLGERLLDAMAATLDSPEARTRAGIATVLAFITEDPRRARVLFTEGRTNAVLTERRRTSRLTLVEATAAMGRTDARPTTGTRAEVAATMFGGAMEELVDAWTSGRLGTDLDAVVDDATALSLALFDRAAGAPPRTRPGGGLRPQR